MRKQFAFARRSGGDDGGGGGARGATTLVVRRHDESVADAHLTAAAKTADATARAPLICISAVVV